jgi:hypothetical protein
MAYTIHEIVAALKAGILSLAEAKAAVADIIAYRQA